MIEVKVHVVKLEGEEVKMVRDHGFGDFHAVPRRKEIVMCPDGISHYVEQVIHQFNGPTIILLIENEE